jgi:hypothetical protein
MPPKKKASGPVEVPVAKGKPPKQVNQPYLTFMNAHALTVIVK